jgi:outer membrane protein
MTTIQNKTINHNLFKNMPAVLLKGCFLAALVLLLISKSVNAQERAITLDEAIKLGQQNSKLLKLSKAKIDEAVSVYNQAKDEGLPSGKASYGYNRAEIPANRLQFGKTSLSLPKSADAYLGTLSLTQVIFGGNRLKYAEQSTDLLTQVARLDANSDKDEITYDIINSYYNLYKVLQSKKVVDQNLATIDQQIKQSQRFFDQGLVTKNDVLRFQLQHSNVELNGIDLETNRKIINYNLDILLGLPESTRLSINEVVEPGRVIGSLTSYIDTALANRNELRSLDLRTKVAETSIKNIKANTLPALAASGSAYYVDVSANPIPQSGTYITPISIGLTLSWNFGSLWTNKNKVSQANIQREEVVINRDITLDNVKRDINQNYQNYTMAVEKIKLLQTSIAQAGENNKILQSKYQSNIASATDRADAETLLYQAQINLELAKADAGLAYYNLLRATGKLNK